MLKVIQGRLEDKIRKKRDVDIVKNEKNLLV